jgi:ABC-type transport system substrate-binding protein
MRTLQKTLVNFVATLSAFGVLFASNDGRTQSEPYKADPNKIVRYAFEVSETSMDPHRVSDLYSNIVNSVVFDAPLTYDYLARPLKLKPNTLAAMPEVSADQKTITLRVKPGIYFSDDPAFRGKKRELVAADYEYSLKRLMDPRLSAQMLGEVEDTILGADVYTANARKAGRLDYDAPLEGVRALDRYTLQIKLNKPKYIFIFNLADCRVACAVAREVVEYYGDNVGAHPVGTGSHMIESWKRSSKMVFVANPNFREEYFDAEPAPDDKRGQEILAKLKGKRLPMVGRVEVSIIEEQQPRLLAFQNREHDLIFRLGPEFSNQVIPNNQLAPYLKSRGLEMAQIAALDVTFSYFNMEDPIVGGYTPEKVALRRAISLGYMTPDEIQIIWKGQAVLANAPYSPGVAGHDPNFRTSANEYSPSKANALLDLYGYKDIDGDGYRELPDGKPLVLQYNSTPTARDTLFDELWTRSMDQIGIKLAIRKAKWPDLLKESNAGKLMTWFLGGTASIPDADTWLATYYSPNKGFKGNRSRFELKAYDDAYRKAEQLPDGPERTKLYQEMARLIVAYAPAKINTHRVLTDIWFPYLIGYARPPITSQNWWKYVDVDVAKLREYEAKDR